MKSLLLFVASLALATSFSTTARADKTVSESQAKQFVAFFDKFADTAVADKASCPKMVADMNAELDANKAMLDRARAAAQRGEDLPKDAKEHLMQAAQRMMPAFQACGSDAKFKAAMGRLNFNAPHHR